MRTPALPINRRRFLSVAAAVAGSTGLARAAGAVLAPPSVTWQGIALGAPARLTLQHWNEAEAKDAIAACLAEVARLEAIFSLHRPDSALVRLNANGVLEDAPADLRTLLAEALMLAARTGGAFDPTIQPLWRLRAGQRTDPVAAPDAEDLARVRELVGWQNVHIEGAAVRLAKPGMALTLNGIAQGYITDKVGDLLAARGYTSVLVDMGEQRALGPKWDGAAWRVGLSDPYDPQAILETMELAGGAVSTSSNVAAGRGPAGALPNILEPQTGRAAERWASLTVVAERATRADGLSTALTVLEPERWRSLAGQRERIYAVPMGARRGFWV